MKKVIFLILTTFLVARENPFILPKTPTHSQSSSSSTPSQTPLREIKTEFLTISIYPSWMKISSIDKLKKVFRLGELNKVVVDFSSKRSFSSKHYSIKSQHFKRVDIGAHDDFYRLAVALKECKPKIEKKEDGLYIFCR
ncbi:MAG: AMIN domain-containing protein [Epsilonproteobacteria bacterium]|nr:AMIN domain-containing protein [Campylobacterota bacterium]